MIQRFTGFFLLFAFLFAACGEDPVMAPKPRAYPKVEYPAKTYQTFDKDFCSFTFEYPAYAEIQQDSFFFEERPAHPCWFDIYFPAFDSRLHCSYTPLDGQQDFDQVRQDAFEMANYHNRKANYIDEILVQNRLGAAGIAFDFEGDVASPFQFYLTDSLQQHFFRAALYFNTQARSDSLAPIVDFLIADFDRMIETFQWEE